MTRQVGILLFDDVQELDAVGPYEVFGTAADLRPDLLQVFTIAEHKQRIRCVNGLHLLPHHSLTSSPRLDVLVIPGGSGTRKQAKNQQLLNWIVEAAQHCKWVASVCSGARLTIASELARGKRITSHHDVIAELKADGRAEVVEGLRFVRDGNLIHSAGVSAGIDMSLWLVGELAADPAVARAVQREMEYYPAPPYAYET